MVRSRAYARRLEGWPQAPSLASFEARKRAHLRMTATNLNKKPRGSRRGVFVLILYCRSVRQDRQQQERHDVGDLDHRVDGGTGRVLVGLADGVAGYRRLVRLRALAAIMAVLAVLLGVVPGAAARGHQDRDEQAGDDHP